MYNIYNKMEIKIIKIYDVITKILQKRMFKAGINFTKSIDLIKI